MLFARHNRVHDCGCVCEFYEKIIFSDSFRARILLSTYNISTDQSKDDYHLETAGDYVLNTLLVLLSFRICAMGRWYFNRQTDVHLIPSLFNKSRKYDMVMFRGCFHGYGPTCQLHIRPTMKVDVPSF